MKAYLAPASIGGVAYLAPALPPASGLPPTPTPTPTPAPAFYENTFMREAVLFRTAAMSDSINLTGSLL